MKTIGLIGGMSWESTLTYYQVINEEIKTTLKGLHSAKIILYSVDFAEIETCQAQGDWEKSAQILLQAAQSLEKAGADFLVICTNTMHKVIPMMENHLQIPIVHIADATADALLSEGIRKVALLGTKYTMTQDFYKNKLMDKGIEVLIPGAEEVEEVNRIIYEELCLGEVKDSSRVFYQKVIKGLKKEGAQGVILGCTEIGLLIQQKDSVLPVFDTAQIHALTVAHISL